MNYRQEPRLGRGSLGRKYIYNIGEYAYEIGDPPRRRIILKWVINISVSSDRLSSLSSSFPSTMYMAWQRPS